MIENIEPIFNVHITDTDLPVENRKTLLILTRPWFDSSNNEWYLKNIKTFEDSEIILIPFPVNYYFQYQLESRLYTINENCVNSNKKAYAYIAGDSGFRFSEFSNIIYLRPSGFKSQLSPRNTGIPVAINDHFQSIYKKDNPVPRNKPEKPVIGFCGHASISLEKKWKEKIKFLIENLRRFFLNPFRRDWEPLFASAYERAQLLLYLEKHDWVKTNFIYRKHYRAGARTLIEREKTTLEYFENINNSDYILCVRGGGNFSVRFYETLMMGKIPVLVDTDCLLPFEDKIEWKNHIVWVEWNNRHKIGDILSKFHQKISDEEFKQLQLKNRQLWKETLSVNGMLKMIYNDI